MNVGVHPMRADLKTVLADAKTLTDAAQRVRCMRNPDANLLPMDGTVGNDVIDRLPPVVLFALGKVLDSADPNWASKLDDAIVKLPEELTSSGSNICEELRNNFEATRCEILRRPAFQSRRVTDISNVASGAADLLRSIKDFAPEEVVVHVAVVVAVGGGGTNIPLPIHGAIEAAAILLDKISGGMDRMTDRQDECSAADEKMEHDLLSCTALASCDADMSRVLDVAQRRLDLLGQSSEANGLV
jgi:hypothetical protein